MWLYFLTRFGLVQAGSIEERPGIPPTPSHLVKLVNQMKQERIKVIVVEPWGDLKTVPAGGAGSGGAGSRAGLERWCAQGHGQLHQLGGLECQNAGAGPKIGPWPTTSSRLMWVPFLMCLVLTGIHAYLGLHVIAREVRLRGHRPRPDRLARVDRSIPLEL